MPSALPYCIFISMKTILGFLIAFNLSLTVEARSFELNKPCKLAFDAVLSLRLEEGKVHLANERLTNPGNLIPLLIENYADFLTVFISEEASDLAKLQNNKQFRINAIDLSETSSPYYGWAKAAIYLQSAFARMKFGEQYAAAIELRKAYFLLENNQLLFPDFLPGKMGMGLVYVLLGSVPQQYQWMVSLASMKGDVEKGRAMLYDVVQEADSLNSFSFVRNEALFFLSYIEKNLNPDSKGALKLLPYFKTSDKNNLLSVYAKANIEMRIGRNDEALRTLSNRPNTQAYLPFHYLEYMQAEALLRKLDTQAIKFYQNFFNNFQGQNYKADAIRKIAWAHLIKGNEPLYIETMSQLTNLKAGQVEADKQAMREVELKLIPNFGLLKARLLFDGGYFFQAKAMMVQIKKLVPEFSYNDRIEFHYRYGRIEHELGLLTKALEYYRWTYENGTQTTMYFAANAALKAAEIYESTGNAAEAKKLYKLCLSMKPEEYRQGIHLKAKSGLNRIEKP